MVGLWARTALGRALCAGGRGVRGGVGLLQMLALVVVALGCVADEGLPNAVGFTAFAVAFGSVAVMYALPRGLQGRHAEARGILAGATGVGALVLLTGMFLPDDAPWTLSGWPVWILAVGVGTVAVALVDVVGRVADILDREHLSERLGQIVIIVLGESFMSLVTALGGRSTIPNPLFFVITFLVVFAIWTLYFSSVLPAGPPHGIGRLRAWLMTHWLLLFGAVAAAAGFSAVTLVPFGGPPVEVGSEWTTLPLAFVMAALSALSWLGSTRVTALVRMHLLATGLLALLAVIGMTVSPGGEAWEIVAGSCVVMADAVASVRMQRPYSVSPAGAGTPPQDSGPSPS
jgi:low temperature requirement protein LtrA